MHKFMRAIGFSKLNRKAMDEIIKKIINNPQEKRVSNNPEGDSLAEYRMDFADDIGIMVRGIEDENGEFIYEYHYPYIIGTDVTKEDSIDIEKHSDREAYAGISDDMHLGVTLVFYMQNVVEYLDLLKKNDEKENKAQNQEIVKKLLDKKLTENNQKKIFNNGVILAGLSTEGRILLPIADQAKVRKTAYQFNEKTKQAVADLEVEIDELQYMEDGIEDVELDTYEMLSRRIDQNEDILSIVSSTFMPDGIETDQYSILGDIMECKILTNTYSKEKICRMKVRCNGLNFDICINEKDLLGVPEEGRRFKGNLWMQGKVCL